MHSSRPLPSAGLFSVIDWITAHVPIRSAAGLRTGEVSSVDADGVVEWVSAKRKSVQGSHSGTITIKRFPDGTVEFAGSPAKFLQGHNVFGSDDLLGLGSAMIERACAASDLELLDSELADIRAGRYDLKRVDINYSFVTGTRENALAWIKAAASVLDLPRRGPGRLDHSTTVIWGEKSRYWKLKAYCKGKELEARDHQLSASLPKRTELKEWSDDKLRVEVTLLARPLKTQGLNRASSWRDGTPRELFDEYVAKLRVGKHQMLTSAGVQSLPHRLRQTYTNWIRGEDLRQLMADATYYRHLNALLKHGINIAVPPQGQVSSIPLSQYLETPCMEVPAWAVGTELYWQPDNYDKGVVAGRGSITVRRESGVTRMAAKAAPGAPQSLVVGNHEESVDPQTQLERHNPLGEAA